MGASYIKAPLSKGSCLRKQTEGIVKTYHFIYVLFRRGVTLLPSVDKMPEVWYTTPMQAHEAKPIAMSAAANSAHEAPPQKAAISAAVAYLCGKTDKAAFAKKCAKSPLYARLILVSERQNAEYGIETLCFMHKTLYEPKQKCGELRTADLTITGGSCTPPTLLRGSLKNVLAKLSQMQSAPAQSKADFAATLCAYVRELIILSPFAYGNDIVRRAFFQNFCYAHGFILNYAAVSKKELTSAETAAFASDDPQPLFTLLVKCLSYRQDDAQKHKRLGRTPTAPGVAATLPPRDKLPQSTASPKLPSPEKQPTKQNDAVKPSETAKPYDMPKPAEQPKQPDPRPSQPARPPLTRQSAATEIAAARRPDNADVLRELKEVQRALLALTNRVNDLIKKSEEQK